MKNIIKTIKDIDEDTIFGIMFSSVLFCLFSVLCIMTEFRFLTMPFLYLGCGVVCFGIVLFILKGVVSYMEKIENCCENCCELCGDGKAPYCMPNGDFKEVLSMDYVCDDYSDCGVKIKKFCEENKIEPFEEYLKRIGKGKTSSGKKIK